MPPLTDSERLLFAFLLASSVAAIVLALSTEPDVRAVVSALIVRF